MEEALERFLDSSASKSALGSKLVTIFNGPGPGEGEGLASSILGVECDLLEGLELLFREGRTRFERNDRILPRRSFSDGP